MKLLVERGGSRRILGCVMVGYEASTMIAIAPPTLSNFAFMHARLNCGLVFDSAA